jgi:hypothetical protein
MSRAILITAVVLALIVVNAVSLCSDQVSLRRVDSRERFNEYANRDSDALLLRVMQHPSPYPGHWNELSLKKDGSALSARIVPDWAVQGSKHATLTHTQVDEVRQMIANLLFESKNEPALRTGDTNTVFVFFDGQGCRRVDLGNEVPSGVRKIMDFINGEILAQEEARWEEVEKHEKRVRQVYGHWEDKEGVVVPDSFSSYSLSDVFRGQLVVVVGRQRVSDTAYKKLSLYSAVVIHPEAALILAGGCGGRWGFDPVAKHCLAWTASNSSTNIGRPCLEINYNAVENTVSVGSNIFSRVNGNLFLIQLDDHWNPTMSQLKAHLREQTEPDGILRLFKSCAPKAPLFQNLELSKWLKGARPNTGQDGGK